MCHDEITIEWLSTPVSTHPENGSLLCTSISGFRGSQRVEWYLPDSSILYYVLSKKKRTAAGVVPIVQLKSHAIQELHGRLAGNHNGLWTCRFSRDSTTPFPVGMYQRGGGEFHY